MNETPETEVVEEDRDVKLRALPTGDIVAPKKKPKAMTPAEKIAKRAKEKAEKNKPVASDADLLAGIKSSNKDVRRMALNAIFPLHSAVLIVTDPKNTMVTATDRMDAPSVFQGLLFVAQQIGRFLGLELNWIPDPAKQKTEADKIVIAPEGSI